MLRKTRAQATGACTLLLLIRIFSLPCILFFVKRAQGAKVFPSKMPFERARAFFSAPVKHCVRIRFCRSVLNAFLQLCFQRRRHAHGYSKAVFKSLSRDGSLSLFVFSVQATGFLKSLKRGCVTDLSRVRKCRTCSFLFSPVPEAPRPALFALCPGTCFSRIQCSRLRFACSSR